MRESSLFVERNPFVVVGKIPAELFCDRKVESGNLVREVTNGNNLVLISSRRMGKTGLIQHCFDLPILHDNYETFYIDILQTSSLKEFVYFLGKAIFQRLASRGEQRLKMFMAFLRSIAGSFGFDPFNGTPTFNLQLGEIRDPEMTIEEIFLYLEKSERPSIIAIDEFQQIVNYKEKNVEAMLRSHIQKLSNANFIFAGSERHLLRQMFNESSRPFFNSASMLVLDPIKFEEYAKFATLLFSKADKRLDVEVVKHVYDSLEGNTFYLQRTFNMAYSKTVPGGECGIATVEECIRELLSSYDTIYREILAGVGESQKELLVAVAKEGHASAITSGKFMKKHALPSSSAVQSASKRLIDTNLLTRDATTYHLQDPLLRLWLLHTY